MKYKELPDWVSVLKKDPRLASIGFKERGIRHGRVFGEVLQ